MLLSCLPDDKGVWSLKCKFALLFRFPLFLCLVLGLGMSWSMPASLIQNLCHAIFPWPHGLFLDLPFCLCFWVLILDYHSLFIASMLVIGEDYIDRMISSQIHMLKHKPQCNSVRKWGL